MTDEQMVKLCGEAMGFVPDGPAMASYDPFHDGGQCFALVKQFNLELHWNPMLGKWAARWRDEDAITRHEAWNLYLNHAICECAALLQLAKNKVAG